MFASWPSLVPVMANNEKTSLRHPAPVCARCQSPEMRRLRNGLPERLFSLQRFHCSRCKHRQRHFRFGWFIPVRLALATSLIAGLYFLAGYPLLGNLSGSRPTITAAGDADSLAQARNAMGGQISGIEQMMTRKPLDTLDNNEVLSLWHANVGVSIILQMIRTTNGNYNVKPGAIIALRAEKVDQTIILAMIDANYRAR